VSLLAHPYQCWVLVKRAQSRAPVALRCANRVHVRPLLSLCLLQQHRWPAVGRQRSAVGRRQPPVGRRQPPVGRRQPSVGRRQPRMGRQPRLGRRCVKPCCLAVTPGSIDRLSKQWQCFPLLSGAALVPADLPRQPLSFCAPHVCRLSLGQPMRVCRWGCTHARVGPAGCRQLLPNTLTCTPTSGLHTSPAENQSRPV
jgi:hypothetical protein